MGRPQKNVSGIPRILNADLVAEHAALGDASQYTLCTFNILGASPYPNILSQFLDFHTKGTALQCMLQICALLKGPFQMHSHSPEGSEIDTCLRAIGAGPGTQEASLRRGTEQWNATKAGSITCE